MFIRKSVVVLVCVAVVALAIVAGACGGDENGGDGGGDDGGDGGSTTTLDVGLTEFEVAPSISSVPAGSVTFEVTNDGAVPHDLQVISTDLAPDQLPVDPETFTVDTDDLDVVATSGQLDAGESKEVAADLSAGSYVLICNIPTHYEGGMYTTFTVLQ